MANIAGLSDDANKEKKRGRGGEGLKAIPLLHAQGHAHH